MRCKNVTKPAFKPHETREKGDQIFPNAPTQTTTCESEMANCKATGCRFSILPTLSPPTPPRLPAPQEPIIAVEPRQSAHMAGRPFSIRFSRKFAEFHGHCPMHLLLDPGKSRESTSLHATRHAPENPSNLKAHPLQEITTLHLQGVNLMQGWALRLEGFPGAWRVAWSDVDSRDFPGSSKRCIGQWPWNSANSQPNPTPWDPILHFSGAEGGCGHKRPAGWKWLRVWKAGWRRIALRRVPPVAPASHPVGCDASATSGPNRRYPQESQSLPAISFFQLPKYPA